MLLRIELLILLLHVHGTFIIHDLIFTQITIHAIQVRHVIVELTASAFALHAIAEAFLLFIFLLPVLGLGCSLLATQLYAAPDQSV